MRSTVGVLALLVVLAACGSGDEPASSPSPATESTAAPVDEALQAAVQAYSDAVLTGNADSAYSSLSERCRAKVSRDEFGAIVAELADTYGSALPFESYQAEVSSGRARVTYTFSVGALDKDEEPWVLQGPEWTRDAC